MLELMYKTIKQTYKESYCKKKNKFLIYTL